MPLVIDLQILKEALLQLFSAESTSHEALKLLESHGISFLPVDNSTLLTSALESGQSISLTGNCLLFCSLILVVLRLSF